MSIDEKVKKALFDAGISKLADRLSKKGWQLDIGYFNQDEMHPDVKEVHISSRFGLEKQLYSLLHECGHILVQKNAERYEKSYPATARMNCYATTNRQFEKSPKYRVDVLAEDIEAWRRGKSLANRVGLYIDEEKYNEFSAKCVYSYIQCAAK